MNVDTLKVAGWQKVSLIDYPGKIASVIFLAGCNMRCHYCHNRHILSANQNQLSFGDVLHSLRDRRAWVDAVVVSGGEPTMYPNLIPLLEALKSLKLQIKLDTNGTNPAVIQNVVARGLVDYIALDIKAPAYKHQMITGLPIDTVLQTAKFLKTQNQIPYMLRTTLSPRLHLKDMLAIGKTVVDGALCWQIQQCRCVGAYSAVEIQNIAKKLEMFATHLVVVGL